MSFLIQVTACCSTGHDFAITNNMLGSVSKNNGTGCSTMALGGTGYCLDCL